MAVKPPTLEEIAQISRQYFLNLSQQDLLSFQELITGSLGSYDCIDALTEPSLPVEYSRSPGYRPDPEENILNAWYWKTSILGAESGKLKGKTVAIKDNVCVAGIPMMNGCAALEGYVPEVDATIVTRLLDAGAEIKGKAVCEDLCISGHSFTSATGPVLNPHNHTRSAGGSSSGSAALVASGEVDMATGGDQGGSIRIPAAWCGIVGLKPTHGLVPYTGVFPIELTLDHHGPMTRTVADCALMLEVMAGPDGLDPRQYDVQVSDSYSAVLTGDLSDYRIGVLKEGFAWPNVSELDVDELIQGVVQKFSKVGAQIQQVSVPMHRDGVHLWNAIAFEGVSMFMIKGNSMGTNWKGHYTTSLLDAYARGWKTRANDLSETTKLVAILGQYMQDRYHGRYYAKAQNLARKLKFLYDKALEQVDVLVMPTTPMKATAFPGKFIDRPTYVSTALGMVFNTCPFDVTGHPAISLNAGLSEGLPVGLMIVGRHWQDAKVLQVAHALEQLLA